MAWVFWHFKFSDMKKHKCSLLFFSVGKIQGLLFIFLLISKLSQSQTAGYMGKHCILECSGILSPNRHPVSPAFSVNYIVTKRKELCFGTNYFKSTFNNSNYPMSRKSELSWVNFSLGLKLFGRRKAWAPIGGYLKWEVLYYLNTIHYYPFETTSSVSYYHYLNSQLAHQGGSVKYPVIGGAFGIGRQRVFFDRMIVDYGLRICLAVPFYKSKGGSDVPQSIYEGASDLLFERESIMLHVGLGFLAF